MTDDVTRPIEAPATTAEPTAASTGTEPVTTTAGAGASRLRWAIALGVAGLAGAVAIGAFILLGSRPTPEALKYIPADAAVVVEVRMDLPGDQLQKLGNLLAHFPGFADQSTLPAKIDESLSRIIQQAGKTDLDYVRDIKPWLSGPAFAAIWAPTSADAAKTSRALVSASTTGTVSCDKPMQGQGQPVTHETYKGLDLFVSGDAVCVLDGRQALLGDSASVHAAIDAHVGGSGMDREAGYRAARSALTGDQLATIFVNGTAYRSFLSGAQTETPLLADLSLLTGSAPDWAITGIRAEDDALVVESFAAPAPEATPGASAGPSLLPLPATHPSVIAPLAPANTIFYAEAQGAGVGLQNLIARLRTLPNMGTAFELLDGMGGAGQLVGWVDDAGIIVVNASQKPSGGLALVAADDAAAAEKVKTLTGLLAFAGLGSNGIETHESTIAGVTVTTITINDVAALIPPGQLPAGASIPPGTKVEFSIAAKGRVILLGTGEDFMTAVLGTQPGSSLSDQPMYKQATSRALANSRGTVYVGIHDIMGLAETFLPADEKAKWESDLKPYLAPFQALSITSTTDASGAHQRLTITVSQP